MNEYIKLAEELEKAAYEPTVQGGSSVNDILSNMLKEANENVDVVYINSIVGGILDAAGKA